MSEGGAIILLLGLFSVGAFMVGWVVCMFNGYYEYKKLMKALYPKDRSKKFRR